MPPNFLEQLPTEGNGRDSFGGYDLEGLLEFCPPSPVFAEGLQANDLSATDMAMDVVAEGLQANDLSGLGVSFTELLTDDTPCLLNQFFIDMMPYYQPRLRPAIQSWLAEGDVTFGNAEAGLVAVEAVRIDPEAGATLFPRLDNQKVLRQWIAAMKELVNTVASHLNKVLPKAAACGVPDTPDELYVAPVVSGGCRMLVLGDRNLLHKKVFKTVTRVVAKAAYLLSGGRDIAGLRRSKDGEYDMDVLVPILTAALKEDCKFSFRSFPAIVDSSLRYATVTLKHRTDPGTEYPATVSVSMQDLDCPKPRTIPINKWHRLLTVPFAQGDDAAIDKVKQIFLLEPEATQ